MARSKKVKPEDCPGHEWIMLRSVRVCWHCTQSQQIEGALTPSELAEERMHKAVAAKSKATREAKKRAALVADLSKLPKGVAGLLPAGSGKFWEYPVAHMHELMPLRPFKRDLRKACKEWAGKSDLQFFRAAQVFFASTIVGPNIDRIAHYLCMKHDWVAIIGQRYTDSGIWEDGKICTESVGHKPDLSPEVEMELVLIIMCGMGQIRRGQ